MPVVIDMKPGRDGVYREARRRQISDMPKPDKPEKAKGKPKLSRAMKGMRPEFQRAVDDLGQRSGLNEFLEGLHLGINALNKLKRFTR